MDDAGRGARPLTSSNGHGGVETLRPIPPDGSPSPGRRPQDYRNIFGTPSDPRETFRAYLDRPNGLQRTKELFKRIARRMSRPFGASSATQQDNPSIPSGYVYLSQLVGHDLSFIASAFPSLDNSALNRTNLRDVALNLDTIYGGGPIDKPFAYCPGDRNDAFRRRLRLSLTGDAAAAWPNDPHERRKTARDIPRAACPHLNDSVQNRPKAFTEVLIADQRNDDNPILAQTAVLFHMLHNSVVERLAAREAEPLRGQDLFEAARGVTTYAFRKIVLDDLMRRLLNPTVYAHYRNGGPLLEPLRSRDPGMPIEFSHAAFRIGHYMARPFYQMNVENGFPLRNVLETNSTKLPRSMPLSPRWLIDWSHFYEIGGRRPVNLSFRIRPYALHVFHDPTLFGGVEDGLGLPYRDLLRSAPGHMRSVASLAAELRRRRDEFHAASPFLSDPDRRRAAVVAWIEAGSVAFDGEDVDLLTEDPPLIFFILMEAAANEDGLRLGALGSTIVAETIYGAVEASALSPEAEKRAKAIFSGAVPSTMPALIEHLADRYDLRVSQTAFIGQG